MRGLVLMLAVASAGCLSAEATVCDSGRLCPGGMTCDEAHDRCVVPEQLSSCRGAVDGTECSYPGVSAGVCFDELCTASSCGDGIQDPDEVCDDGNRESGDDCNATCVSKEVCGNGFLDGVNDEECDDGNLVSGDGCQEDCRLPRCGDEVTDALEDCDEGAANSDEADATCRTNCRGRRCGDGVPDTGEVCDDGNPEVLDGCTPDCASDETCGNSYVDAAKSEECDDGNDVQDDGCHVDCKVAACGDEFIDTAHGEECDDGDLNSDLTDGHCRSNCLLGRCGDAIVDTGELCDDGNSIATDGCTPDCDSNVMCGNSYIDFLMGEECDDGDNESGDGCSASCWVERCGNAIVDTAAGEVCDDGNVSDGPCPYWSDDPSCDDTCNYENPSLDDCPGGYFCSLEGLCNGRDTCSSDCHSGFGCGNGVRDVGEGCDDGNEVDTDSCVVGDFEGPIHCELARCGDGIVYAGVETCDHAGESSDCDFDCTTATCGDARVNQARGEQCDPANGAADRATCDIDCTAVYCGDAHPNAAAGEDCDDGNLVDTDACPNDCTIP